MESILHRCGTSPFGGESAWYLGEPAEYEVLVSDAVVIVGGEPIPSGVLIDWLPSRKIIGPSFLQKITPA